MGELNRRNIIGTCMPSIRDIGEFLVSAGSLKDTLRIQLSQPSQLEK